MHMPTSEDGAVLSHKRSSTSLGVVLEPKNKNLDTEDDSNLADISNSSISEILRNHERCESGVENLAIKDNWTYTKPYACYSDKHEGKVIKYGQDVHIFYVFDKNPFQRLLLRQSKTEEDSANCSILCQIQNSKNTKSIFKKLYKTLQAEQAEAAQCCDASNQCKKSENADKAMDRLVNLLTEPMECKCFSKKRKRKKHSSTCHCAEAETQSRRHGGQSQRAGRESFYREIGTSGNCNCLNKYTNFLTKRSNEPNDYNENIYRGAPKCTNPSTRCQADDVQDDLMTAFRKTFHRLIEPNKCKRLAFNIKHGLTQVNEFGGVEAKTQSRRYDGRQQRAGRECYCREIGTSGNPTCNMINPEPQDSPREFNYGRGEGLDCVCDKPATMNRRIGSNGGCNMKYCNMRKPEQKYAQPSVYSQFNSINNEGGVFKKLCHIVLEGSNVSPLTQKCCKDRGTLCQVDDEDSTVGIFKKYFQLLTVPTNVATCKSNDKEDNDDDDDSTLKKFLQIFQKQIKTDSTGTEATTQSRYYGGRQERAGREVFYKNRGTSGAPKPVCQKPEEEEYEEDIVEECPTCEQPPAITIKAVGIGTNCKYSFGWYKDRLGYGEPKPQKGMKMTIDEWNEVPLRQTGTKIGASLNADAGFTSYNTNAATQSRKFRGRHLRAGRETFYREQQTSCVPKNIKPIIDGINTNLIPQPVQTPPPDRKSLRLGSDCSFCFEFYKDVPPESPENVKLKPCEPEIDTTQNKNSFYSKLIPQWLASQVSERGTYKPNQSDACTHTEDNVEGKEVCECEKNIPKVLPHRKPLHIGSNVSYHFNFEKSISPPKVTSVTKEPCISYRSNGQKEIETNRETNRDVEISSESVPDCVLDDDFEDDLFVPKTPKEIIKELFTKKTLKRLIKGEIKKTEIEKAIQNRTDKKEEQSPRDLKNADIKAFVCRAKCKNMKEPVEKPDQPFRIGSSFSFDYDMHKLMPKQEKKTYNEKFPQLEDFSGSPIKMNVFRLIVGKIRKRVRKKAIEPRIPVCPCNRDNKTWLSFIISNIKRGRHVTTSCETETKNFFSRMLSGKSSNSSRAQSIRLRTCRKRKLGIGSELFSYFLTNLKERKIPEKSSTETFFSQMLAKKRDPPKRRRRRRRRGRSTAGNQALYGDDILNSPYPESRRSSRTSGSECEPCRVTSDCCFKCDYNKLDETTDDTQSTASTISSRNYATT